MFSQTTDYALRSVAHLANCREGETTVPEMAQAIQVNVPYLRKVINKLCDAGIVAAQRGKGGGIRLQADPDELTILDVVNATEPMQRIESCPLGLPDHMKLCSLHAELDDAVALVEKALGSRTIGQLLATRRSPARCGFPKSEELHQL
ncbi:MAG: RrF2 family transcriptional regulator [Bythopirellula sp.]